MSATLVWLAMHAAGTSFSAAATVVTTTTIADTVYHADGSPASGLLLVSWGAFTTAGGQAVPAGSVSAAIATGGAVQLSLAPNAGATPAGTYYTAVYHLDDGSTSRETWVVPSSATPVTIGSVRSMVVPASVAVQTVTKTYVDNAIAAAVSGSAAPGTVPFVTKTGDAMVGPLTLPGDPTASAQAASKHYVDASVAALAGALTQGISSAPSGTQTITQPQGTQLITNRLNGELYASQYVNGQGHNGIVNAAASADCASGCVMKAEPSYTTAEAIDVSGWRSSAASGTHLEDTRGAARRDTYLNPVNPFVNGNDSSGQMVAVISTRSATDVSQTTGSESPNSVGLEVRTSGLTGGSNLFPASIEGHAPYFKSNYLGEDIIGSYNTMGQHVLSAHVQSCFGVGDCLMGAQFMLASGGFRDEADEGAHPFDLQIREDTRVFTGTCASGCTPGSTTVQIAATASGGTQGEGRYLVDLNPALALTGGILTGGTAALAGTPGAMVSFSGTQFPVSVFLKTTASAVSQAHDIAPGQVNLAIATSGVPSGFATNTSALLHASGVACVADGPNSLLPTNFETATYTVVDGTHLQIKLNKPHAAGATVAVGGLCGYGLEQKVDTVGAVRQVFPVIGSASPTSLWYAAHTTAVIGQAGQTGGFLNVSLPIASIVRSGGLVTVTTGTGMPVDLNGLTMTVAGVADASLNGSFQVTTTSQNTLTFRSPGSDATSGGGTIAIVTGSFGLYPMAEVLGVTNSATHALDGTMTLAPNTVPWAANDPVEQPHYFEEAVQADQEFISQFVPRPTVQERAGLTYSDTVTAGMRGWTIQNAASPSSYLGNGGTRSVPDVAYEAMGAWNRSFEAQAGDIAAFQLHCNSRGCGRWNSAYDLFELDSSAGVDTVNYAPQTSTYTMNLRGTTFGFGPGGFSAGVLNAGTVNATTLNGNLDAAKLSGTVSAARLPVFGRSGAQHASGAVPDPGATPGLSRFLREDGTWATPPVVSGPGGGGGGASGTANITGGTIDGTVIGGSTPAAGTFSQLAVNGCDWLVQGPNQGIGTCTPTSWGVVQNVDGTNLQIAGPNAARLIIRSAGGSNSLAEFHFVNTGASSGSQNWRLSNDTSGVFRVDMNSDDYSQHTVAIECQANGTCRFPQGITAANFGGVLSGTTGIIGGNALAAGACTSGGVDLQGAVAGTPVVVSASDGSLPGGTTTLNGAVTSSGHVTVQVCAITPGTPAAKTYNVRVLE